MPSWVTITRVCLSLIVGACLGLAACSSGNGLRDLNYGTDVAVGFIPPDAAVLDAVLDGGVDSGAGAAADGIDTPGGLDSGVLDVAADQGD